MDKDLLKGVALLVGVIVAVAAVFLVASNSGPQKAKCIASALKSGVAYGNIDKTCNLTRRSY
jgi:gas vesicle protein